MKRSDRLKEVQRSMEDERRVVAQRFATKRDAASVAAARLQELLRYREEYLQRLRGAASGGLNAARLRNYQAFLAKLDLALKQQQDILGRARADAEFEAGKLRDISGQIAAVGGVADRWVRDERCVEERRDQNRADEHGQRIFRERHDRSNP